MDVLGTNNGLNIIETDTQKVRQLTLKGHCPVAMSTGKIQSLLIGKNAILWIGTASGLCRITLESLRKYYKSLSEDELEASELTSLNESNITTLFQSKDGKIWIGTRYKGAFFFSENAFKDVENTPVSIMDSEHLSHPWVMTIIQINNGDIWLGTYGGGVTVVDANDGHILTHHRHDPAIESSLNMDRIGSMLVDKSGLVWVGTWGGGLNLFNPFNTALRTLRSSPFDNKSLRFSDTHAILELDNQQVWVGHSQKGIDIINPKIGVVETISASKSDSAALSVNSIRVIKQLRNGSVWAGTAHTGILFFEPDKTEFEHLDLSGSGVSGAIRNISEVTSGKIWIGTDSGLILLDSTSKKPLSTANFDNIESLYKKLIIALKYHPDNYLWVASTNGLFVIDLNQKKVTEISLMSGNTNTLSDNYISDVIFDNAGKMIVSTAQGLDRLVSFDGENAVFESLDKLVNRPSRSSGNLMEDSEGRIWDVQGWLDPNKGNFENLNISDGFDIGTTWYGSNTIAQDGTLIYGGTKGLLLVRPELWQPWEYQPPVVITELTVENQKIPITEDLLLPGNTSSFSVEFAALDYTDPESNQYAYMLEGFDQDWIATAANNRRATYTNLPPGQYHLKIKGTNRKGLWSNHELDLVIRQMPAWYQTSWFKLLVFLGISTLLFVLYQWRVRRLKSQRIELDNMVKFRTANISMLGNIGQEITSSLDLDTVLETVYKNVNTLMKAEVFAIGILNEEQDSVDFPFNIENGNRMPSVAYAMTDVNRPAVWCISNQKELVVNSEEQLGQFVEHILTAISGDDTESIIYLPLIIDKQVLGCISVQSFSQNAYSDNDVQMLRTIGNYAAIALANADSVDKLEKTLQELKETQNQLVQQEKMAGLGTLTAGVMHEINNPTNFTYTSLYSLREKHDELFAFLRKLAGGDDADQEILELFKEKRDELESITFTAEEGTRRIKKIVADLQNLSRIDKDQKKRANIKELLDSSINLTRTNYPNHTFDTQGVTSVDIACYPAKLSQVLLNLLVNACQAIEEAKTNTPDLTGLIQLKTELTEGDLQLSIVDNGCGMDDITLKKAFEPFFTTKDVGSGTGLGMSISYGIIKEHSGTMTVESKPGKGTTIRLCLPLELNALLSDLAP